MNDLNDPDGPFLVESGHRPGAGASTYRQAQEARWARLGRPAGLWPARRDAEKAQAGAGILKS